MRQVDLAQFKTIEDAVATKTGNGCIQPRQIKTDDWLASHIKVSDL